MPRRFLLAALAFLSGCAAVPPDELAVEQGEVVEVARFSRKQAGELPPPWQAYPVPFKPRTSYRLVESDAGVVLEAHSERSASGKFRPIRVDPRQHPLLEWRWRVPRLIAGADPRDAAREDSPVRVFVAFDGDHAKLPFEERAKLDLARALTGQAAPYATLMYVWSNELAPDSVVENPRTSRVRMVVVESGGARLGRWLKMRRNVLEDYRRVFGEEPGEILAVGVMTDADNTAGEARAFYGDISFLARD